MVCGGPATRMHDCKPKMFPELGQELVGWEVGWLGHVPGCDETSGCFWFD